MKEINIFREVRDLFEKGERITLATIASTSGSTPAGPSAKMIVREDGSDVIGTVGGGCLEVRAVQDARIASHNRTQRLVEYEFKDDEIENGLICGGSARILVEPLDASFLPLFKQLVILQERGEDGILVSRIEPGSFPAKTLIRGIEIYGSVLPDNFLPLIQEQAAHVIQREKPEVMKLQHGLEFLIEPIIGYPALFIFGGGHISSYVAHFAKLTGFKIVIIDDREKFANPRRFPEADEIIVDMYDRVFHKLSILPTSFIVIVTRGHKFDELALEQAVKTQARYVGMIGSKRKVILTLEKLRDRGVPEEKLNTVFAPLGLDLEGKTPPEIGISIVSELIKIRRKGTDAPVRHMAEAVWNMRKAKRGKNYVE